MYARIPLSAAALALLLFLGGCLLPTWEEWSTRLDDDATPADDDDAGDVSDDDSSSDDDDDTTNAGDDDTLW